MRTLSLTLLLLMSTGLFAGDGEKKEIDGQVFVYNQGIWTHEALGSSYEISKEFSAVYKSKKWQRWYQEGSPTLQKILNLGPNVIFKFKDAEGKYHVYSSFKSKKLVKSAVAGGAAAVASGLGGAAAAGAAVAAGGAAAAGAAAAGAAAAATATVLGVSVTTAAVVAGAVVAGAVVVEANNDDDPSTPTKK